MPSSRSSRKGAAIARSQRQPGATPTPQKESRDKSRGQADDEQRRNARMGLAAELRAYKDALARGQTAEQLARRRTVIFRLADRCASRNVAQRALDQLHARIP